jgi:hypothetical protein
MTMASGAASFTPSPATVPDSSPRATLALANVRYEKKDSIAHVTVNRPQVLNALNTPTWTDLRAAFEEAKARPFSRSARPSFTGADNNPPHATIRKAPPWQTTTFSPD